MQTSSIDELSLERECVMNSSSSSVAEEFSIGDWIKKERGYFNGETLSQGYKRIYGNHWSDIPFTIYEQKILGKFTDILDLIDVQKVYHFNGIIREFDEIVSRHKIAKIQPILVRRGLLKPIKIPGLAKATLGIVLLCTRNATKNNIKQYLIEFNAHDSLRLTKEEQRSRKRITNKEQKQIWANQSTTAEELRKEKEAAAIENPTIADQAKSFLMADDIQQVKDILQRSEDKLQNNPEYTEAYHNEVVHDTKLKIAKIASKRDSDKIIQMVHQDYPLLLSSSDFKLLEELKG